MQDKPPPEEPWQAAGPEFSDDDTSWYPDLPEDSTEAADTPPTQALKAEPPASDARLGNAFKKPYPWLTWLFSLVCILIWLGIQTEGTLETNQQLAKWGFYSYDEILNGKIWGLISANFFHQDAMHLLFNLVWLLLLGSKIEREAGRLAYLALVFGACLVSSGSEIGLSDQSGIGISGVVYGLVGFILIASLKLETYQNYLSRKDFVWLLGWLFACIVLTQTGVLNIANAAHFGGLLWGMCFAAAMLDWPARLPARLGLVGILSASLLPLVWLPWSPQWLAHRGTQAFENKDMSQAEYYLSQAAAKNSEQAYVYILLGDIYEEKKPEKALEQYLKAEKLAPIDYIEERLAKLYYKLGKYDEALNAAEKVLAQNPDKIALMKGIAAIKIQKFDWSSAKTILEKFLEKAPKDKDCLYLLGFVESKLDHATVAESYYQRVLVLDKNHVGAQARLLELHLTPQKWELAEKKALAQLKQTPSNDTLLGALGYGYLKQKRYTQAIATYTKLFTLPQVSPNSQAQAHYNVACSYALLGNKAEALSHLGQAFGLDAALKTLATKDKDLAGLKEMKAFKQLLK